jgi:hypothetical protein
MARRGMLKVNGDGKPQTPQQLPDGKRKCRVYVVLPTIFEGTPPEPGENPQEPTYATKDD